MRLAAAAAVALACGSPSEAPPAGYPTEGELPLSSQRLHFDDGSVRLGAPVSGGRGVALTDVDDDGWPDVTLTHRQGVRLLRGVGDGRFEDWAELPLSDARGVAWADVDDDGDRDLYVSARADHALFINDGGVFRDGTAAAGLAGDGVAGGTLGAGGFPLSGEGVSFGDLDSDGDLDLFLAFGALPPDLASGEPGTQGSPDRLYWNVGGGRFERDTTGLFDGPTGGETFQGAMFDADRDGDQDLFAVYDHRADRFFRNDAGGFVDASVELLPNQGTESTSIMGIELIDADQDGDLDVYGTQREGDLLYRGTDLQTPYVNAVDKFRREGAPDPTRQSTGWGVAVQDFDNDGDVDLLRTSNFDDEVDGPAGRMGINLVFELVQEAGVPLWEDRSAEAGVIFDAPIDGWGLATADLDRDGDLDALIGVDGTGPDLDAEPDAIRSPLLLINRGAGAAARRSARLRLRQPGRLNRYAVGAIVDVHGVTVRGSRVLQAGQSYLSQHDDAVHAGLGPYERLPAVVVTWPGGHQTTWLGVPAGEHLLERPADDALNCCVVGGACGSAPDAAACRGAAADAMGIAATCVDACTAWRGCCPQIPQDLCVAQCREAPPPEPALRCLAAQGCDGLLACTEDGAYVPGNLTGQPSLSPGALCPQL